MVPVKDTTGPAKGQELLNFIQMAIASGRTVYLTNAMKSIAISPRTIASWNKAGNTLFKLTPSGDLLMASGSAFVRITSGSIVLMKVTAS